MNKVPIPSEPYDLEIRLQYWRTGKVIRVRTACVPQLAVAEVGHALGATAKIISSDFASINRSAALQEQGEAVIRDAFLDELNQGHLEDIQNTHLNYDKYTEEKDNKHRLRQSCSRLLKRLARWIDV